MRWQDQRRSDNIEDQRGGGPPQRSGNPFGGGGGGRIHLPMGRGGMGIGGLLVVLVIAWFAGINPIQLLTGNVPMGGGGGRTPFGYATAPDSITPVRETAAEKELADFVSVVLATTEDVWRQVYRDAFGKIYQEPKLVLFRDGVRTACGSADSAMGPFYCPGDRKVYIDLSFYDDLKRQLGAPGDFAQAYVIAHEVGHHVQHLLGISDRVHGLRARQNEVEQNQESVKLELQADYFAGVWAHHAGKKGLIEVGDIDEALNAARAIGDDRLQQRSSGRVVPDSFTHGTSEQRSRWFKLGYESGDPKAHDPFTAKKL
ncbi:MAG: zinc metallopeptidase [Planctomycetes bacterium]|nr:zinc metallopeptidase [Planctomycetota bacterium]